MRDQALLDHQSAKAQPLATTHLIQLRHARIGLIGGPDELRSSSARRDDDINAPQ
ncbi:hypothetical protein ACIQC5_11515 [Paenarthrobacter sp. NPDC092416]|uniref:hypothetical protein n=1 Tax=Paenarthrobacter sp. NPDC092416 TaxID=3364386 RepID=UPI0037F9EC7B